MKLQEFQPFIDHVTKQGIDVLEFHIFRGDPLVVNMTFGSPPSAIFIPHIKGYVFGSETWSNAGGSTVQVEWVYRPEPAIKSIDVAPFIEHVQETGVRVTEARVRYWTVEDVGGCYAQVTVGWCGKKSAPPYRVEVDGYTIWKEPAESQGDIALSEMKTVWTYKRA